jgi:hypothetical protein
MTPKRRAILATMLFAAAGIVGSFAVIHQWRAAWPEIVIYALVVWNDYRSIAYFSTVIEPDKLGQVIIDWILVILNLGLACFLNKPIWFLATIAAFFSIATMKYASELSRVPRPELLFRKVVVDLTGTIAAIGLLAGVLLGYGWVAMPLAVVVCLVGTLDAMYFRPLYEPPHPSRK